jgi:hypothetical protein
MKLLAAFTLYTIAVGSYSDIDQLMDGHVREMRGESEGRGRIVPSFMSAVASHPSFQTALDRVVDRIRSGGFGTPDEISEISVHGYPRKRACLQVLVFVSRILSNLQFTQGLHVDRIEASKTLLDLIDPITLHVPFATMYSVDKLWRIANTVSSDDDVSIQLSLDTAQNLWEIYMFHAHITGELELSRRVMIAMSLLHTALNLRQNTESGKFGVMMSAIFTHVRGIRESMHAVESEKAIDILLDLLRQSLMYAF